MIPTIVARALGTRALRGLTALAITAIAPGFAHAEPYVADPGFNHGRFYTDAFAGGPDFRYGKKIVQTDDGDVIVAGIVPAVAGDTGGRAIGLVRYDAAGVRQAWSNPGADGYFGGQYVIHSCGANNACDDVKDLVLFGSRLYVLADANRPRITFPPSGTPDYSVDVFVFGTDGSYKNRSGLDADLPNDDGSRSVYGGGIAVYDNGSFPTVTTLVYGGTGFLDGVHRPRYGRYTVESDGGLTEQNFLEPNPDGKCPAATPCQINGIALGGRSAFTTPPRIYLVGSRWHPGPPPGTIGWDAGWDYLVMGLNASGTADTGFGFGVGFVSTEGVGSQSGGQGIAVKPGFLGSEDEIFVMADVQRICKPGIAVLKHLRNGQFDTAFGSAGRVFYGGSDESNATSCNTGWATGSIRADYPKDIAYADGKLGVVGFNVYRPGTFCTPGNPCPEDDVDGELAVIDAADGTLESWRGYAYSDTPGGARSRHNGFWGVVASGGGTFTATGDVRRFETAPAGERYTQEYATMRLAAQGDRIFADGFDGAP